MSRERLTLFDTTPGAVVRGHGRRATHPSPARRGMRSRDALAATPRCVSLPVSPAQAAAFTAAYNAGIIPQATLGQLSQLTGGNVALQPEKAKSYSFGFLFSPTAVPALTGSIDWYEIKLDGTVGVLPANVILTRCLDTGDPAYCSQLVRQPNTFSLTGNAVATGGYIVQTNINVGANEISGIDLQTNYRLTLPGRLGKLAFALNGAYLLKSATTPLPGAHTYDCAGLFGSTCQPAHDMADTGRFGRFG